MGRFEREIIPILRRQRGFQDVIVFVNPSGSQAFSVSLWDRAESAEAYSRGSFGEVSKILAPVVEGPLESEAFNVVSSTVHKIAAAMTSEQEAGTEARHFFSHAG
jgi:heme-degrading monooxygenase HmoA